jgi:hypothetical protein
MLSLSATLFCSATGRNWHNAAFAALHHFGSDWGTTDIDQHPPETA